MARRASTKALRRRSPRFQPSRTAQSSLTLSANHPPLLSPLSDNVSHIFQKIGKLSLVASRSNWPMETPVLL